MDIVLVKMFVIVKLFSIMVEIFCNCFFFFIVIIFNMFSMMIVGVVRIVMININYGSVVLISFYLKFG